MAMDGGVVLAMLSVIGGRWGNRIQVSSRADRAESVSISCSCSVWRDLMLEEDEGWMRVLACASEKRN